MSIKTYGCARCAARWTGLTPCHCSSCHLTFGGVRGFDRHRKAGSCLDPASLGLELSDTGIWMQPAPTALRQ